MWGEQMNTSLFASILILENKVRMFSFHFVKKMLVKS